LFLGREDSFAVDARDFAWKAEVTGGCAYFTDSASREFVA
jgi:hypothetical protein